MKSIYSFGLSIGAAVILVGCAGSPSASTPSILSQRSFARSATYKLVYAFGVDPDGEHPSARLTKLNGTLYGTTGAGGLSNNGIVFSVTPDGVEKVLYSFRGGSSDGARPNGLVNVNGTLYGTTAGGGDSGPCKCGVIFDIIPTGTENVLYRFRGGADGAHAGAALTNWRGTLYGTTYAGGGGCGVAGCGTVYRVSTAGAEKVLYSFKGGSDGNAPYARLIAINGTFFGTTYLGGGSGCYYHNGCGTVYSVTPQGSEKTLYRFKGGSDGANPDAGLTNVNGILYGTTASGGFENDGTVFSVTTSGVEKVLHRFGHDYDGYEPEAGLLSVNGTLYGTTWSGSQAGTVYSISTTGSETVLYNFSGGRDGANPSAPLVILNGMLYGTTYYGGRGPGSRRGTIFALAP